MHSPTRRFFANILLSTVLLAALSACQSAPEDKALTMEVAPQPILPAPRPIPMTPAAKTIALKSPLARSHTLLEFSNFPPQQDTLTQVWSPIDQKLNWVIHSDAQLLHVELHPLKNKGSRIWVRLIPDEREPRPVIQVKCHPTDAIGTGPFRDVPLTKDRTYETFFEFSDIPTNYVLLVR